MSADLTAQQGVANAAAEAELHTRAAARAQAMWDGAADCTTHPYLTGKGVGAYGVRIGEFWNERKEDGEPFLVAKDALLIRMRDAVGTTGLQAICAKPIKVGEEERDKDFVYGAKKAGCWATIGKPTELNGRITLLIVEGYATGASVHEATGLGVIVAFDSGNLLPVAREVRRLMPAARLVFAADDDPWTERPVPNPALTKARDAAATVGGEVIAPTFADVSEKPTDWNDLHALAGLPEVRRQLMAALDPQPEAAPEPEPEPVREEPPPIENIDDFGPMVPEHAPAAATNLAADPPPAGNVDEVENPYFRVLGHGDGRIHVFVNRKRTITSRGEADWPEGALTAIAPLHWWELNFPGEKGMTRKVAVNWLQRMAEERGVFDREFLRGRGAWRDDGRFVFHFGHKLWVDGQMVDVAKISSEFIYEQRKRMRLPAAVSLPDADGRRLFETFQMFAWTRPASAILMAGWCVLAPIGGALRWRPHVWITGGPGSGKSTLLNFIDFLLNGASLYAQGNSTEAGIRQALRTDSRPVLFDESEQNNERETLRMQNVLSLVRQSSTESNAQTLKGTVGGDAMHFTIRSMFCLGSIQVGLKQQADMERISILSLKPKRSNASDEAKAAENWESLRSAMTATRADAELPAKLLHRTLTLLPVIAQNIEVFAQAAAKTFGSQREGDQYGALLAGAWSLVSTKLATLEDARAMIARYDWSDYLEGSETDESEKALAALMRGLVRVERLGGGLAELMIFELLQIVAHVDCDVAVNVDVAAAALRRDGLAVKWSKPREIEGAKLLVAESNSVLARVMTGTPYEADVVRQLLRLPGVEKADRKVDKKVKLGGSAYYAMSIPLRRVLDGDADRA